MLSTTHQQVIQLLVRRLEGLGLTWALTGSASFALHGMDLPVHDIDVQTDKKSAYGVEAALVEYSTQPVHPDTTSEVVRSYLGALEIMGVKVEIMGDMQKRAPVGMWEEPVDIRPLIHTVRCCGASVPVLRLDYEITAYRKIGRPARAEEIRRFIASRAAGSREDGR